MSSLVDPTRWKYESAIPTRWCTPTSPLPLPSVGVCVCVCVGKALKTLKPRWHMHTALPVLIVFVASLSLSPLCHRR